MLEKMTLDLLHALKYSFLKKIQLKQEYVAYTHSIFYSFLISRRTDITTVSRGKICFPQHPFAKILPLFTAV